MRNFLIISLISVCIVGLIIAGINLTYLATHPSKPLIAMDTPIIPPDASPAPPRDIVVSGDKGVILIIHGADGTVERGPGLSQDAAAQALLDSLIKILPDWKAGICQQGNAQQDSGYDYR